MKALIIDGEELFRLSLKEVIRVSGNFHTIIEASDEHEFLAKTANQDDLSLVIIHPSSLKSDGDDCMKLVNRLYPDAAVVTVLDADGRFAGGCPGAVTISRGASVAQMVNAIRRALRLPLDGFGAVSSRPATPNVRAALERADAHEHLEQQDVSADRPAPVDAADLSRLSYRQRQILSMAADGLPNKEIAARLDIAEGTVKAHMHAIFKVLGVSNRTQAVIRYGATGHVASRANGAAAHAPSWTFANAS